MLPFYIFTWPEAARALLMYRYHTLPGARAKAAKLGYRGALYAWESTDSGEETTPENVIDLSGRVIPVLCGLEEHHISADIAYAVWQYWQATQDEAFFLSAGAEILLETARFWASRATLEEDGHYHIRRVIGPDEYHETIDDNAYTNTMAAWNIERGLDTMKALDEYWPDHCGRLRRQLRSNNELLDNAGRAVAQNYSGQDDANSLPPHCNSSLLGDLYILGSSWDRVGEFVGWKADKPVHCVEILHYGTGADLACQMDGRNG